MLQNLVLLFLSGTALGQVWPTNTVAEFNKSVALFTTDLDFSSTGTSAQWLMTPNNENGTNITALSNETDHPLRYLYYAEMYYNELIGGVWPAWSHIYSEHRVPGQHFGIEINFLDLTMEGQYELLVLQGFTSIGSRFHVAGTSRANCNRTFAAIEGDATRISCSVQTSNNNYFEPVLTWYQFDKPLEGVFSKSSDSEYTTWTLEREFNIRGEDFNNAFSCNLRFRFLGPVIPGYDTSDPIYDDTCSVTYDDFKFSVRETLTSPSSDHSPEGYVALLVSDSIYCFTNGSKPVTYNWRFIQGNSDNPELNVSSSILNVTADMVGKEINIYQCIVENYVQGIWYEDFALVKFIAVHQSEVYIPPDPVTVGFLHQDVIIPCTMHNGSWTAEDWIFQWAVQFSDQVTTNIVYRGNRGAAFIVTPWSDQFRKAPNLHDITVINATADMAGNYACFAIKYPVYQAWQTELVLTSQAYCAGPESARKGDQVDLFCGVDFHGNDGVQPVIQWFYGDELLPENRNSLENPPKEMSKMKWELYTFTASDDLNEVEFNCKIQFQTSHGYLPTTLGCDYRLKMEPGRE